MVSDAYSRGWQVLCCVLPVFLLTSIFSCAGLQQPLGNSAAAPLEELIEAELAIAENSLNQGQPDKAWQNLRPLLEQYPNRVEVLTLAGLALMALHNNERALQVLSKAYRLKKIPTMGLNLSSAYIALAQYDRAEKLLHELLASKEPYSYRERLWHNLALVYDRREEEARAKATYLLAIRENPTYYLSHLHLAKLHLRHLQERQQAQEFFLQAHRFCTDCFEPVEELTRLYLQDHKASAAIELLQAYLQTEAGEGDYRARAQRLLQQAKAADRPQYPVSFH